MARNFDGTDDEISYGSDASVDDIFAAAPNTGSVSFWLRRSATGFDVIIGKRSDAVNSGWWCVFRGPGAGNKFRFNHVHGGLINGDWDSTAAFSSTTALLHFVVTYDASLATNDPVMYVNGVLETVIEVTAPVGLPTSDAGSNLQAGESDDDVNDFAGDLGWLCIGATIWTAADANRARWWGRPFGGLKVYHPMMTDKLANEGSATANGTVTGTTVASLPVPVVRPGTAMMGLGVGW